MNFYAHRSFDSQKFPNFQRIIFFDRTEAIFDSVQSEIFQYDSLKTREFWCVKTPMSIQWFEVHRV